ncbi:MAG: hypothetical protein MRY83_12205, partial [Flavobacteriales bacterium]|nr:hypothetical protein [Flavobacteriales bacterium]
MKKITLLLVFATTTFLTRAQQLDVAHISGGLSSNEAGVYGIQGLNSNPHPESLANACMWSSGGEIYLFGGEVNGSFSGSTPGISNKLWKWTKSEGWEFLDGSLSNASYNDISLTWNYSAPSYGTQNVSSSANYPGARVGAAYATGSGGTLYMYGGYGVASDGVGALSDLWEYDPSTEEWTWIAGSDLKDQSATYSTLGSSSGNSPGQRIEANMWVDNSNDIWVFGGGIDAYDQLHDNYNSTMKYDGTSWIWVSGSSSLNDAGSTTQPSARRSAAGLFSSDGKFYLFGGTDNDVAPNLTGSRGDFWSFDGATWTIEEGTPNADGGGPVGSPYPVIEAALFEIEGQIVLYGGVYTFGSQSAWMDFDNLYLWNSAESNFEEQTLSGSLQGGVGAYESPTLPSYNSVEIVSGAGVAVIEGEAYLFG